MKKRRIAVVGGGLSGLAAAYTLLKSGACTVDVFEEKQMLGGRVQSKEVNGQMVDLGGFLVFPWYKNCHALIRELGIARHVTKTPIKKIYYVLSPQALPVTEQELPFSKIETLQIWSKALLRVLPEKDVARPTLHRFGNQTISEYLRAALGKQEHAGLYETFFDTVNQGYCYGPAADCKVALMAPIARQTAIYGDVRNTAYFPHGIGFLVQRLSEEIVEMGGQIHLGTPITGVKNHSLKSGTHDFHYDAVIFAQNVSAELYRDILPHAMIDCWYTHFLTAVVKFEAMPRCRGTTDWGALFYAPDESLPQQVLSAINLSVLYGPQLRGYVTVNVILRSQKDEPFDLPKVSRRLRAELKRLLPDGKGATIKEFIHWERTMPVAQESFVEAVRKAQGKHDYYFAGDFLGAPSIETAISTGISAARLVLESGG